MDENPYQSPTTAPDNSVPVSVTRSLFSWTGMAIAIFTLVIAGIAAGDDALIRIGLVLFFVWIGSYFVVAIVTRRIP
jgi:hypothetical protein